MLYHSLGAFVVLLHLIFIVFALMGGLLVSRWRTVWLHVPCMGWIALNQCVGWNCPLTLAEKWFNQQAATGEYHGGFISHYVAPLLGPEAGQQSP